MTERKAAVLLYAAVVALAQRCGACEGEPDPSHPEADTAEEAP
jgi:hypothetical protein